MRIINTPTAAHPKVRIDSIDAVTGLCVFSFLNTNARPVDSGGSVARFTPAIATPATETEAAVYAQPSDAALAAAIVGLADQPSAVPSVLTRTQFVIAARRVLGITEGTVFALISQLPQGETQETARDLWVNAVEFHRDNTFLNTLAQLNGNASEQIDEVFRVGAALDLN